MEPLQPGDDLTAEWLNGLLDLLERATVTVDPTSGLQLAETPGGSSLTLILDPGLWIKITAVGTAGDYAWKEQVSAPTGWVDGPTSGTTTVDPAHEQNNLTTVLVNTLVFARRAKSTRKLLFQSAGCT